MKDETSVRSNRAPQISVMMGIYCQQSQTSALARSIESILEQDFTDFELLVCDDGSTQEVKSLLDCYAQLDSRIRLLRPGGKHKLAEKLNVCLKAAKGEYTARMDDDDYSHPDRFRKQLSTLLDVSQVDFVGCNVNLCRNGQVIGTRVLPRLPQVKDFLFVQPFIHPALMFRRAVLSSVGGYSEDKYCELCEDYDLLLRLYIMGSRGMNLQDCLLDYTISQTAKGNRTLNYRLNETVTRFRRFRELGLLPGALAFVGKPLAVGLLPEAVLLRMKDAFYRKGLK